MWPWKERKKSRYKVQKRKRRKRIPKKKNEMDNNNKHYLEAIMDIYLSCDRERKKEK